MLNFYLYKISIFCNMEVLLIEEENNDAFSFAFSTSHENKNITYVRALDLLRLVVSIFKANFLIS